MCCTWYSNGTLLDRQVVLDCVNSQELTALLRLPGGYGHTCLHPRFNWRSVIAGCGAPPRVGIQLTASSSRPIPREYYRSSVFVWRAGSTYRSLKLPSLSLFSLRCQKRAKLALPIHGGTWEITDRLYVTHQLTYNLRELLSMGINCQYHPDPGCPTIPRP